MRPRRQPLRSRLWRRVKRLLGLADPPDADPPGLDPALVPAGPPRGPRPSSAVALEEPDEPDDVDAVAR